MAIVRGRQVRDSRRLRDVLRARERQRSAQPSSNPPITVSQTFNANPTVPNLTYTQPFLDGALNVGALNVAAIDKNFDVGRIQQWNVNLQQQLYRNLVIDVGYVGSRGDHLQRNININAPVPGSTPIQSRRPYPLYGTINMYRSIFPSRYNALQTKLDGRFGSSNLLATYTFSKSTDILSSYYNGGLIQDPYNLEDSRGPSNFDRRHVVNVSYVAALPFGRGQKFLSESGGFVNALVSDWQVNGIATFASGNPVTVILATDNSGTAQFNDRPNQVGDPIPANQGPDMWLDPAAYAIPPPFTYGDAGRNPVVGPGISRVDISLFKGIRMGGDKKLDLRFEMFNAFESSELLPAEQPVRHAAVREDHAGLRRPRSPARPTLHVLDLQREDGCTRRGHGRGPRPYPWRPSIAKGFLMKRRDFLTTVGVAGALGHHVLGRAEAQQAGAPVGLDLADPPGRPHRAVWGRNGVVATADQHGIARRSTDADEGRQRDRRHRCGRRRAECRGALHVRHGRLRRIHDDLPCGRAQGRGAGHDGTDRRRCDAGQVHRTGFRRGLQGAGRPGQHRRVGRSPRPVRHHEPGRCLRTGHRAGRAWIRRLQVRRQLICRGSEQAEEVPDHRSRGHARRQASRAKGRC